MNKYTKIISILFILLTYSLIQTTSSFAQTSRTMTITPPGIAVKLNPGGTTEGTLGVINDSDEPLTFNATIQDYTVEDNQGTPNILPPNTLDNRFSAAAWIGVSPSTFTVEPHKRQNLNYYIQLPPDARPGGHYAAVIYTPALDKNQLQSNASVYTEIGTLFYITVNGPITESAMISRFLGNKFQEYGPINLLAEISNFGDLHIKPSLKLTVTDMLGRTIYSQPVEEHNIFPGKTRDFQIQIGSKWMFGQYKANIVGTYGSNNNLPLTASLTFVVFPWKITIIAILIIIALTLGFLVWKKRKDTDLDTPTEEQIQNPEVNNQESN